uniref:Mariner Mos1 transposase n=1 Tax=Caenorhabditis japonica TaxID=281687 RepID=A0A8R1E5P7_CAEJA
MVLSHNQKRQWVKVGETAKIDVKPEIHENKVMLSIWWDRQGIIYCQLLPDTTTINADVYCSQIENMINQQENTICELDVEVLPHPPHCPALAATDYHLLHSLQDHLHGKMFDDRKHLEPYLDDFFNGQPAEFYARGIKQLPTRWQYVVDRDCEHIDY